MLSFIRKNSSSSSSNSRSYVKTWTNCGIQTQCFRGRMHNTNKTQQTRSLWKTTSSYSFVFWLLKKMYNCELSLFWSGYNVLWLHKVRSCLDMWDFTEMEEGTGVHPLIHLHAFQENRISAMKGVQTSVCDYLTLGDRKCWRETAWAWNHRAKTTGEDGEMVS